MAKNNSDTNFFGITKYVVWPSGGAPYYSTIQSAINAASASGGGTVYVKEGSYFENLTLADKVTLVGPNGVTSYSNIASTFAKTAVIFGVHTFSPTANAGVSFSNLFFFTPNASTTDVFTFSPSTGTSEIDFANCTIDPTANAGLGNCMTISPTGSASVNVRSISTVLVSGTSYIAAIGSNSSLTMIQCSANAFNNAILLNSATSVLSSSFCNYFSQNGAAATMTANGLFNSFYDSFNSTAFVTTSSASGRFVYAHATSISGAGIGSGITPTNVTQNPNVFPIINGQIAIGSTGLSPVLSNITAGTGISVANAAGSITLSASPPGGTYLTWQSISASATLASNNGYIISSGTPSLALPATAALGSVIVVLLNTGTSWTITQATGQSIRLGNLTTTSGVSGSISSTNTGDSVIMMCTTANTTWSAYASIGNLVIV